MKSFKHAFEAFPVSYSLDDAGNITAKGAELFTYDSNRLSVRTELVGVFEYGYDLLANQVSETELGKSPTTTEYDAAGFSRKVTEPDGSWVTYRYDGLERMVAGRTPRARRPFSSTTAPPSKSPWRPTRQAMCRCAM